MVDEKSYEILILQIILFLEDVRSSTVTTEICVTALKTNRMFAWVVTNLIKIDLNGQPWATMSSVLYDSKTNLWKLTEKYVFCLLFGSSAQTRHLRTAKAKKKLWGWSTSLNFKGRKVRVTNFRLRWVFFVLRYLSSKVSYYCFNFEHQSLPAVNVGNWEMIWRRIGHRNEKRPDTFFCKDYASKKSKAHNTACSSFNTTCKVLETDRNVERYWEEPSSWVKLTGGRRRGLHYQIILYSITVHKKSEIIMLENLAALNF